MKWWGRWKRSREQFETVREEKFVLLEEIQKARMEWEVATKRLDHVVEKDQVDYAIYAMEAAEKRYEMLLRAAKQMKLSSEPYGKGRAMGG